MVVELKEYESAVDIAKAMDSDISRTKSILGEYLRRLDDIRSLAEKTKKVRQVVMKLAGKKVDAERLGEINVDNVKVVLDASPLDELNALESVVRSHQERLLKVQKARECMKTLDELGDTEGVKFLIVETDGVPERILLNVC